MARISTTELANITKTQDITELQAYIDIATHIIDTELVPSGTLNANALKFIELYLSAHLLRIQERQKKSESLGDSSITYMGQDGMFLEATTFGQTAIMLDTTNRLKDYGKDSAFFHVLNSQNNTYNDYR